MTYNLFFKKLKKKLSTGIARKGGRNFLGRVCVRGIGGGNKRIFRFIDFYRRINLKGRVINVLYDPNRTSLIGVVIYVNSFCSYLLFQKGMNREIYSGTLLCKDLLHTGSSMPLKYMPLFSNICNIELKPFLGSTLCRAAGTSCMLVGKTKDKKRGILKLNSKWEVHLSLNCISSVGAIAMQAFNNRYLEKAGKNRAFGVKPSVRGVAKNPCDHPHGGGNGKKPKPKVPVNAWHTVFKWAHTKNKKKDNLKRRKFKNLNEN